MYSDRNLINRRNVKADVDSNVNACRRFFTLELECRVVAAYMKETGITDFYDTPDDLKVPENTTGSRTQKKEFLRSIATKICDEYVLD